MKLTPTSRKPISRNKHGAIEQLMPLITSLVAFAIMIVVGFLILSELADNSTVSADPNASQAVVDTQTAMDDIPDWLPIIVVVVIGALLLALVSMFRRQT